MAGNRRSGIGRSGSERDCTRALDVTADPLRLKLNSLFSTFDASGGCLSPLSWQIGMRGLVGFCRDGRCVILNVRP